MGTMASLANRTFPARKPHTASILPFAGLVVAILVFGPMETLSFSILLQRQCVAVCSSFRSTTACSLLSSTTTTTKRRMDGGGGGGGRRAVMSSFILRRNMSDDWSSFTALDDDDDADILGIDIDATDYAREEDPQDVKAEIGSLVEAPTIERDAPPIFLPAGSQLELTEENVLGVLSACREELGTLFGYSAENRGVGITGGVEYVDLDGPSVIVSFKGRYWHQRTTVLDRVANYLQQRIPEIVSVDVVDPWQLTDEANQ